MIHTKEIHKEIVFFRYEEINSKIIDETIEFISKVPKSKNSKYVDGSNILISDIKIEILNNKPYSISIGINISGSVYYVTLSPKKYYYIRGGEINSVDNPDDVNII